MTSIQTLNYSEKAHQADKMSGCYRLHSKIYNLTRWSFLFGRKQIIDCLPFTDSDNPSILEIGCGTGHNLKVLSEHLPEARLTGIDISSEMLDIADKKLMSLPNHIALKQRNYGTERVNFSTSPDCILFSYCLTMVNPDWEKLVLQAKNDLNTEGVVAVVDFDFSPRKWFRRWMHVNHVRMEGHILPFLEAHFETVRLERCRAYFGLWYYFLYIGKIK